MPIVTPIVAADMRVLSDVINKREAPFLALSQMMFPVSMRRQLPTPTVQIDTKDGSINMAAFTKSGTKSIPVPRRSGGSYSLSAPNINIHMPLTASEDLYKRMAGESVFVGEGEDVALRHVEMTLMDDLNDLNERVDMTEEWWTAKLLANDVSYDVDGLDTFELDTGKPAGNDYTVDTLWTASDPRPVQDLIDAQTVARTASKRAPNLTTGICSKEAANAFRELLEAGTISVIKTDSGVAASRNVEMRAHYEENGMRYLGTLTSSGVELWEYDETYIDFDGVTEKPMIRAGYIELISQTSRAMGSHRFWYAAHEDINLIERRMHLQSRVSFITTDEDSGSLKQYMKARPFAWFTRPEWYVSIKVA